MKLNYVFFSFLFVGVLFSQKTIIYKDNGFVLQEPETLTSVTALKINIDTAKKGAESLFNYAKEIREETKLLQSEINLLNNKISVEYETKFEDFKINFLNPYNEETKKLNEDIETYNSLKKEYEELVNQKNMETSEEKINELKDKIIIKNNELIVLSSKFEELKTQLKLKNLEVENQKMKLEEEKNELEKMLKDKTNFLEQKYATLNKIHQDLKITKDYAVRYFQFLSQKYKINISAKEKGVFDNSVWFEKNLILDTTIENVEE